MNKIIQQNKAWIDQVWQKTEEKLSRVCIKSRDKLPYTTVDGVHDNRGGNDVGWWTNGFWGGMMWLMYKETGNEEYRKTAERSEEILDAAMLQFEQLHHDIGFMWHILSGANCRITGNQAAYNKCLTLASVLAARYNVDGGFIRAWNGKTQEGWSIIDCMMNISMLYWASEVTGADRFRRVAMHHADMSLRDHIRPDGSVNHIVEHDLDTGAVVCTYGGQGYQEGSCWSRGQAWALYGMTISYIHTKKPEYLDAAKKTANYFIANCARTGYKPVVDFMAPEEPVYYDSTAAACAACGILELSKYVSEGESLVYTQAAIDILKAMDAEFCDYSQEQDALVLMGSERYPHNEKEMRGVHIPIIYGDFFFVEALLKLRGNDFFIW